VVGCSGFGAGRPFGFCVFSGLSVSSRLVDWFVFGVLIWMLVCLGESYFRGKAASF
jgi:hypothetical protein